MYQSSRYARNLAPLSRVRWVWVRIYRDMGSTAAAKPQSDSGQPWSACSHDPTISEPCKNSEINTMEHPHRH